MTYQRGGPGGASGLYPTAAQWGNGDGAGGDPTDHHGVVYTKGGVDFPTTGSTARNVSLPPNEFPYINFTTIEPFNGTDSSGGWLNPVDDDGNGFPAIQIDRWGHFRVFAHGDMDTSPALGNRWVAAQFYTTVANGNLRLTGEFDWPGALLPAALANPGKLSYVGRVYDIYVPKDYAPFLVYVLAWHDEATPINFKPHAFCEVFDLQTIPQIV